MTDDERMMEVLEKWVEYYNLWHMHPEVGLGLEPTTVEHWTERDRPGYYGQTDLVGVMHGDGWNTSEVLMISTTDGDDGGPSALIAGYDSSMIFGSDYEPQLQFIVHIFDTIPTMIWSCEEGFRVPPDGKTESEVKRFGPGGEGLDQAMDDENPT